MSANIERSEPPNDATAFEFLCLDVWKDIWQAFGAISCPLDCASASWIAPALWRFGRRKTL